jgi:inhibitor of KinA
MQITPLGDCAIMLTLGDSIDEATHRRVRAVVSRLESKPLRGLVDLVPAFVSVTVHYDPAEVEIVNGGSPYEEFVAAVEAMLGAGDEGALAPPRIIEIPVAYGGELGPDLDDVAAAHDMTADDVIRIHAAGDYLVYMVGFMPGFAYLGGLASELATPRRKSPRTAVPAGSVGIGGQQTGVYPMVSPGGWNLIGKTPRRIFDIARDEPSLLLAGDRVRFKPISRAEFDSWRE